jgi:hypothetical protein
MADYNVLLPQPSEYNLHHFTFYPQSDNPVKAVTRHLPINTSQKLQQIFILTTLRSILIKTERYKTQADLTCAITVSGLAIFGSTANSSQDSLSHQECSEKDYSDSPQQ